MQHLSCAAAHRQRTVKQVTRKRQTLNSLVLALIAATTLAPGGGASDTVPGPTVVGPTTGGSRGQPFGAITPADLAQSHYTQAEYFYSGSAFAYEKDGAWGMDGVWRVKLARPAQYKIRLLVR